MPRKELQILTGGLVDADSGRAEALEDNQLQRSDNLEVLGDGSKLTVRKDQEEYGAHVSGDSLNTVLASLFATSIDTISEPYYPTQKPSGMTGDFILLVFGNDGGTYKLYALWETSTTFNSSQVSITGVAYTSSSDMKIFIAEDRVLLTDYVNRVHYYRVDREGEELSGIMGIPAPLNPPVIDVQTKFDPSILETDSSAARIDEPGLFQCYYTCETEDGDVSNPSPISNTYMAQWFDLDTDLVNERFLEKVVVKDLSIPDVGSGSDVEKRLKFFNVYIRVIPYSASPTAKVLEFSQRFNITDKSVVSGATGNDYVITVAPSSGVEASTENDVAPIAKVAAEVGGVTAIAGIKSKTTFPFSFSRYKPITIGNLDSKTYIDAVIKIKLYDGDSSDSNAITGLDWADYDTDNDDQIDSTPLNKIRLYDSDLTTALNVVYTMDTSENYLDAYVKIPQLAPGNHVIYLTFANSSELAGMPGVNDLNLRTNETGQWFSLDNQNFANQTVFYGQRVQSADSVLTMPTDMLEEGKVANRADSTYNGTLVSSAAVQGSALAQLLLLGSSKTIGADHIKLPVGGTDYVSMPDNFGITNLWDKWYISGWFKYDADNLDGIADGIFGFGKDVNNGAVFDLFKTNDDFLFIVELGGAITNYEFNEILMPSAAGTDYLFFFLFSLNKATNKASLFVIDDQSGSMQYQEVSGDAAYKEPDISSALFYIGKTDHTSATSPDGFLFAQWQLIKNRYISAIIEDDIIAVMNASRMMPLMDEMTGEGLGPDNVDDGDMDVAVATSQAGVNWTTDADWDINTTTANKAHATAAGDSLLFQTGASHAIEAGTRYFVRHVQDGTGFVRPQVGGTNGTARNFSQAWWEEILAGDTTTLRFTTSGGFAGDIDGVECYPILENNHIDYSESVVVLDNKQEDNLLKWSGVNGIAFPDLNFKFLREPIETLIPSPSFLKFNYENTFIIFMRNFINRFVLDGDPSLLAIRTDVLIEEKTNFGLQYVNSLARLGEDIFWKSEAGVVHWSPEGLRLIDKNIISIPEIESGATMTGFINPVRNQYLLHNTNEKDSGQSLESINNMADGDGIGNFEDPGTPTYICVVTMGKKDLNGIPSNQKTRSALYARNTTGTVIDLTINDLDILRLESVSPTPGNTYDIKVTDATGGAGNSKVQISTNGGSYSSDISVTANGSTWNNDLNSLGFDIIFADTAGSGFNVNDIMRLIIGAKELRGEDTYLYDLTTNDYWGYGGAQELFIRDGFLFPLIRFEMPGIDMPLRNHIQSIESATLIMYKTVGVTLLNCKWKQLSSALDGDWEISSGIGGVVLGVATFKYKKFEGFIRNPSPPPDSEDVGISWQGGVESDDLTTNEDLSGAAGYVHFRSIFGILESRILSWISNENLNFGMKAVPDGGSAAGRFRSVDTGVGNGERFEPRLAFTY